MSSIRICAIVAIALTSALPVLSQESEHHVVTTEILEEILEELQALREDSDSFLVPPNISGRWESGAPACGSGMAAMPGEIGDIPIEFVSPPSYVIIRQSGNAFVGIEEEGFFSEESGSSSFVGTFEGTIRGNHLNYHRVIHTGDIIIATEPDDLGFDTEWIWEVGTAMGVGTITTTPDPYGDIFLPLTPVPNTVLITEGIEVSRSRSEFDPDTFIHTHKTEHLAVSCSITWHRRPPETFPGEAGP